VEVSSSAIALQALGVTNGIVKKNIVFADMHHHGRQSNKVSKQGRCERVPRVVSRKIKARQRAWRVSSGEGIRSAGTSILSPVNVRTAAPHCDAAQNFNGQGVVSKY
jgi:hypothetical protein